MAAAVFLGESVLHCEKTWISDSDPRSAQVSLKCEYGGAQVYISEYDRKITCLLQD